MTRIKEATMIGLTGGRLAIAGEMVRRIESHESIVLAMGAFVAWDVLDGVLSRRLSVDTPLRRLTDNIVDKFSVGIVALATMHQNPESIPYVAALAAREGIVGYANLRHYRQTGETVPTSTLQRLGGVSTAAFGIGANSGSELINGLTGTLAVATNVISSRDFIKTPDLNKASSKSELPIKV